MGTREQATSRTKEKIIDREVKKSQKWSTILFVVGLLVMLLVLGIVSCYFFVAEKDTIQTINDFCNFKPVSIVIGIIVLISNSFTVSNFYNWHCNPSFVVNKKKLVKIPNDYEYISFEDYMSTK